MKEENDEPVPAKPTEMPEPTYWPFFFAVGLLFIFWGILTSWIISMIGFIVFFISLVKWINILRHE